MTEAGRLNFYLCVDAHRVVDCARALHSQLPPDQWATLTQLAAEVVALQESRAAGETMLVVPLSSEVAAVQAARWVAGKR